MVSCISYAYLFDNLGIRMVIIIIYVHIQRMEDDISGHNVRSPHFLTSAPAILSQ